jgi:hypothetical protein
MSNIVTDRNYQLMGESMIGEALFPTLGPTYDTFPTSRYPTAARFQGSDDFAWTVWPNGDGMIRWMVKGYTGPDDWSAGYLKVVIECEIEVAQRGRKTAGVSTPSGQQAVIRDLYKIREVVRRQLYDSTCAYGPFGITNTTTIAGQGTSPLSFIEDVTFGSDSVSQVLASGDDNNLGPNGWRGSLTVFLHLVVN